MSTENHSPRILITTIVASLCLSLIVNLMFLKTVETEKTQTSELAKQLKEISLYKIELEAKKDILKRLPNNLGYGDKLLITEAVYEASRRFNIGIETILAIIQVESNFERDALSSAGAVGFMQLMPSTFNSISKMYKIEGLISDPYTNILTGCAYLRYLIEYYTKKGRKDAPLWVYVLTAYATGHDLQSGQEPSYYKAISRIMEKNNDKHQK